MPRLGAEVYAAHMDNMLKLARREGGVSRPEIISELNVTRAVANGLIDKAGLEIARKEGRTEYFKAPEGSPRTDVKQSKPEAALAVATPSSDSTGAERDNLAELADLDAQIFDTRRALRAAAEKTGKALGEWAVQEAIFNALQQQMQALVAKRMSAN